MKKEFLFALALLLAPVIAQPTLAATSDEPAATSEPAKKPAKHKHVKHEKHSSITKSHKTL